MITSYNIVLKRSPHVSEVSYITKLSERIVLSVRLGYVRIGKVRLG